MRNKIVSVLDACVLYPAPLRDLLVSLSVFGLYQAKWSYQIHHEWITNLLLKRPDLKQEQLHRTCELMNTAVEDSLVTGFDNLINEIKLPVAKITIFAQDCRDT